MHQRIVRATARCLSAQARAARVMTRTAAVAAAVVVTMSPTPLTADATSSERAVDVSHVMAAFLYNFAKFVTWPETGEHPMVIGIVGDDGFGDVIDATVRGKTVRGRALEVRRFESVPAVHRCQILYLNDSGEALGAELRRVGSGVLTVGDSPHFTREGGLVRFFVEERRVRFHINAKAAEESGLKIHAQLLSLAAR